MSLIVNSNIAAIRRTPLEVWTMILEECVVPLDTSTEMHLRRCDDSNCPKARAHVEQEQALRRTCKYFNYYFDFACKHRLKFLSIRNGSRLYKAPEFESIVGLVVKVDDMDVKTAMALAEVLPKLSSLSRLTIDTNVVGEDREAGHARDALNTALDELTSTRGSRMPYVNFNIGMDLLETLRHHRKARNITIVCNDTHEEDRHPENWILTSRLTLIFPLGCETNVPYCLSTDKLSRLWSLTLRGDLSSTECRSLLESVSGSLHILKVRDDEGGYDEDLPIMKALRVLECTPSTGLAMLKSYQPRLKILLITGLQDIVHMTPGQKRIFLDDLDEFLYQTAVEHSLPELRVIQFQGVSKRDIKRVNLVDYEGKVLRKWIKCLKAKGVRCYDGSRICLSSLVY